MVLNYSHFLKFFFYTYILKILFQPYFFPYFIQLVNFFHPSSTFTLCFKAIVLYVYYTFCLLKSVSLTPKSIFFFFYILYLFLPTSLSHVYKNIDLRCYRAIQMCYKIRFLFITIQMKLTLKMHYPFDKIRCDGTRVLAIQYFIRIRICVNTFYQHFCYPCTVHVFK